jgi:hypothetical protein
MTADVINGEDIGVTKAVIAGIGGGLGGAGGARVGRALGDMGGEMLGDIAVETVSAIAGESILAGMTTTGTEVVEVAEQGVAIMGDGAKYLANEARSTVNQIADPKNRGTN